MDRLKLNPWEYFAAPGVLSLMRLCGCDEKYISGEASDFEKLSELFRVIPMAEGNGAVCDIIKKMSVALKREVSFDMICRVDVRALWITLGNVECGMLICDEFYNDIFSKESKNAVSKNDNIPDHIVDISAFLDSKADSIGEICKNIEKYCENWRELHISAKAFSDIFIRPDRYHAELELQGFIHGEKCNIDLICAQIICELIYVYPRGIIHLHFDPDSHFNYAKGLVEYLVLRGLQVRIYICVDRSCDVGKIVEICSVGRNGCFLTPELTAPSDEYGEFIEALASVYPIGLVNIVALS